jgi:anaerobic dimethyl sulfoxide reductase subunit A
MSLTQGIPLPSVSRRGFLKTSTALAAAGGALTTLPPPKRLFAQVPEGVDIPKFDEESFYWSSDTFNCGGWNCLHKVYVKNGRITRTLTDDTGDCDAAYVAPQARHCVRGAAFKFRVYDPYRVKYPLERTGPRGSGQFKRVSWDYATQKIASELKRIHQQYGPHSWLFQGLSGGGYGGTFMSQGLMEGLTKLPAIAGPPVFAVTDTSGGELPNAIIGSELAAATQGVTDFRQVAENANMVMMVGVNPATNIFICNTPYRLAHMRKRLDERGVKVYGVDPRFQYTFSYMVDEWVPINPQADAALFAGMMYTQLKEGLIKWDYVERFTRGWDQYQAYLLGQTDSDDPKVRRWADGVAKSPEWAERVTGIPASKVRQLGIEYATKQPAALMLGLGPSRGAIGSRYYHAGLTMAIVTGNVGKPGNYAGIAAMTPPFKLIDVLQSAGGLAGMMYGYMNPSTINMLAGIANLELRMVPAHWLGQMLLNPEKPLPFGEKAPIIRAIFTVDANPINTWPGSGKIAKGFCHPRVEFISTVDLWMTATAKYSDIVLPASTSGEREDFHSLIMSGIPGNAYHHPLIKPLWESKDDGEIFNMILQKAGMNAGNGNISREDTIKLAVATARVLNPKIPSIREMQRNPERAVVKDPYAQTISLPPAYNAQINRGAPFGTPSGKFEIYSETMERMNSAPAVRNMTWLPNDYPGMRDMFQRIPPIPKWVDHWEGPLDPKRSRYPLQLNAPASIRRAHSSWSNNVALDDTWGPEVVWINTRDAQARGINNGDMVQMFNDRGTVQVRAFVTDRIKDGVVCLENGRWPDFGADARNIDTNGAQSTITRDEEFCGQLLPYMTFLANLVSHTTLIDVRKVADAPAFQGDPREPGRDGGPWIPSYTFSIDGKAQNVETVNADPKNEGFSEGATWNFEKSQGKTAERNVQGYVSQGPAQTKK